MRSYLFILSLLLTFGAQPSFAQFSTNINAGNGLWGANQACPYAVNNGARTGKSEAQSKYDAIEKKMDDIDSEISDLVDGSFDKMKLGSDDLPFKSNVREAMAHIVDSWGPDKDVVKPSCHADPKKEEPLKSFDAALGGEHCVSNESDKYDMGSGPTSVCESEGIYDKNEEKKGDFERKLYQYKSHCKMWIHLYQSLVIKKDKLQKQMDRAEKQLQKEQDAKDKAEMRSFENGGNGSAETEAGFCPNCPNGAPEPRVSTGPSGGMIGLALGADLISNYASYRAMNHIVDKNQELGIPTPMAYGALPGAQMTSALLVSTALQGARSGSYGCSPGAGYALGPNGLYGNPYGNASPYGQCGGLYAGCGSNGMPPGFNLAAGGGIYPQGVGLPGSPFGNPYGAQYGAGYGSPSGLGVGFLGGSNQYPGFGNNYTQPYFGAPGGIGGLGGLGGSPFGGSPYGGSPYGAGLGGSPFGASPYGGSPYGIGGLGGLGGLGGSPFGGSPYGGSPYGGGLGGLGGLGGSPFGGSPYGGSPYGIGGSSGYSGLYQQYNALGYQDMQIRGEMAQIAAILGGSAYGGGNPYSSGYSQTPGISLGIGVSTGSLLGR